MNKLGSMTTRTHVLIGGGTGFVGRHLHKYLENLGVQVTIVSRRENKPKNQITWNTIDRLGLPEGVNSVVNLAGRNIFDPVPWTASFAEEVYRSRIESNQKLVKAITSSDTKPASFITLSGVGYYETDPNVIYNEEWTQGEKSSKYFLKLTRDWESASKLDDPNIRQITLRSGVVLGCDGGIVQGLKFQFKFGLGSVFGDGKQWFPWIHVDDLVGLITWSIGKKHVSGVINAVAPDIITNSQFSESLARSLDTKVRFRQPEALLRLMFSNDRADIILNGARITSKASEFGYKFKFPKIQDATNNIMGRG